MKVLMYYKSLQKDLVVIKGNSCFSFEIKKLFFCYSLLWGLRYTVTNQTCSKSHSFKSSFFLGEKKKDFKYSCRYEVLSADVLISIIADVGLKQFDCSVCDKQFSCKAYLQQHLRAHSKPSIVCATCGQVFRWYSKYYRHLKLCTGSSAIPN